MIKFGFIGCGKISRYHADVIVALKHRIAAVCAREGSKNISGFAETYHVPHLYTDWRQLIEEQKPDALVVAVSWDETENVIGDIIASGIPCLVEKPVALNVSKLEEIIERTQQFHDRVMVGYNRRFYDFIPLVKQAVETKELLSVELNCPEAVDRLIASKSQRIAEHILTYLSSHWMDCLTFLIGDLKVEWMNRKANQQKGYVDSYNGLLSSQKNIPVHFQANFNTPSNTGMTFNFRDAIYKLCPIEQLTIYEGMDCLEPTSEIPLRRFIPRIKETCFTDTQFKPGFLKQMTYFINTCVDKTHPNKLGCTLENALKITRLCEEIKQSETISIGKE